MEELKLPANLKNLLLNFTQSLKDIYQHNLISVVLYGSAASGEFVHRHSNLNVLIILQNTDLKELKKAAKIINKFGMLNPLFLTEDYIVSSTDVFPIEFLDIQENYFLLYGKDILKNININTENLRFQCEQELKVKLINLRQAYLRLSNNKAGLLNLLFKSFTSVLHILRNLLRLKGNRPLYLKPDIINQVPSEFRIDKAVWEKILAAKNKQIKLKGSSIDELFVSFVKELENLVDIVDKV
jgi:predicted nucleotidyltransferase